MSTRRSRLQVKPNLGPRGSRTANRPGKSDERVSVKVTQQERASPASENLKSPEKRVQKSTPKLCESTVEEPSEGLECQNVERNKSQTSESEVTNENHETVSKRIMSTDDSTDPLTENNGNSLTRIKDKPVVPVSIPHKPTVNNPSSGPPHAALSLQQTSGTESPADVRHKSSSRLRSRFAKKVKPNLSEAGKSRNRRSGIPLVTTKNVEDTNLSDPVNSAQNASVGGLSVSRETVDGDSKNTAAEPVEGEVTPTETISTPVENSEDVTNAEVVVADSESRTVEDVFIPSTTPSCQVQRDLSPSSLAESEISKDRDQLSPISAPERKKQRRRPPKINAPVDKPPDKFKMLMRDLIYWNPIKNPMKVREKKPNEAVSGTGVETRVEEQPLADADPEEEDDALPVPQVKIGPDGSIVLNEESLVIEKKSDQSELSDVGVLDETDSLITYSSFRTRHLSKNWTEKETERFYYALSVVGTDFSMMSNLFKRRNRYDLKKKFKREEKYNRLQVDKALRERKKIDMSVFENVSDEGEDNEPKKQQRKGKTRGRQSSKGRGQEGGENLSSQKGNPGRKPSRPPNKKKKSKYFDEESEEEEDIPEENMGPTEQNNETKETELLELEDDEEEEDGMRTVARQDPGSSSDDDEIQMLENMCQTTRSGRVPKRTSFFTTDDVSPAGKKVRKDRSAKSKGSHAESVPDPGSQLYDPSERSAESTGNQIVEESMEIHTVENIPSAGSQLVLVTQKGEDSQGQGTVIHVYMLSPTSARTPEWSGITSPRPNTNVYSLSPRTVVGGVNLALQTSSQECGENSLPPVISTDNELPVAASEEVVVTSETVETLEQAVIDALRE